MFFEGFIFDHSNAKKEKEANQNSLTSLKEPFSLSTSHAVDQIPDFALDEGVDMKLIKLFTIPVRQSRARTRDQSTLTRSLLFAHRFRTEGLYSLLKAGSRLYEHTSARLPFFSLTVISSR